MPRITHVEDATEERIKVMSEICKDISTVRYDPKCLWEWSDIAMETAREFAG